MAPLCAAAAAVGGSICVGAAMSGRQRGAGRVGGSPAAAAAAHGTCFGAGADRSPGRPAASASAAGGDGKRRSAAGAVTRAMGRQLRSMRDAAVAAAAPRFDWVAEPAEHDDARVSFILLARRLQLGSVLLFKLVMKIHGSSRYAEEGRQVAPPLGMPHSA